MTGLETTSKFSPVKLSVIPPLELGEEGGGGRGGWSKKGGREGVCEGVAYAGMVF